MKFSYRYRSIFYPCLLVPLAVLNACASNTSFDRHNLSRLWVDDESGKIYVDASVSPQYPRDSDSAEAIRVNWVKEWLKVRKQCNSGHRIVGRRELGRDEDIVYRHKLRYEVECVLDTS